MKRYLDLIPISARAKRRQNRMTILCIVFAVFLVSAIFSMADMGIRAEKVNMIAKHGNWHIKLCETDEEIVRSIFARSEVAAASWYDSINYKIDKDFEIGGKKAAICGVDRSFITEIRTESYEGTFPTTAQEVMLTQNAKEVLGIRIDDRIALHTPAGNKTYTVSGFKYDESAVFYDAVVAFVNAEAFADVCNFAGSEDSYPEYYIRFQKYTNVKKAIAQIQSEYGLTDENIAENTAVMGLEGFSSSSYMMGMYGIAAVLVLLVLAAGVLMIASSMNSNVAQRTQFFGMLRCIGASKQQIVRFVRQEALHWCKTAVPIGVGLAVAVTWGLCACLRLVIGGEFSNIPLFSVSAVGVICGIVIGIATVLIAAQSPAKRAARVSPVAAVTGSSYLANPIRRGTKTRFGPIEIALGMHHAISSKKNLTLMTLSFAVSIVMFLVFSSMLGFIEHALPSLRSYTPDVAISSHGSEGTVEKTLYQEIYGRQGVKNVYGNMIQLHTPVVSDKTDEVDLVSYDMYLLNWSENNALLSGDLSKILGDSNDVFTIHNHESRLKMGDTIRIGNEELKVAGELSTGVWSDGKATIVCSEETFQRLTGKSKYTLLSIQLAKDATEQDVAALRSLAGDNPLIDYRENNRQNRGTYLLFSILVYGFLAMIAMITIFNIMNSISMSTSAKVRQYGIMRAIGMDAGQSINMIIAETVTYAFPGCIIGIAAGLPLHKAFFETMVTVHFGVPWAVPVSAIAVILTIVILSCIAAVYTPARRLNGIAVVSMIANEME